MKIKDAFEKVNHYCVKWEPYFDIYERHLQHFRGREITLVEIGILKGGSLELWSEYMGPQAKIIGIDISESCRNIKFSQNNIEVVIGDQASSDFWQTFLQTYPNIDILIDDGGHRMDQQINTFANVFPKLKMNGVYICEDCHTSYYSSHGGKLGGKTFIEYTKPIIDSLHKDYYKDGSPELEKLNDVVNELTSMHYYDSVVVFEKFGQKEMKTIEK
jgi:hypothetical protein